MQVELRETSFNPWEVIQHYESQHPELAGRFGATSLFVGTMRDFNEGKDVQAMRLEHYPAMTQKHLETICQEAMEQWDLLDTLVIHRYGDIQPNDTIVLIAVWSAHRKDSFPACRHIIEELKTRAPFWKQEARSGALHWVEKNTPAE
jgi:molybdopterin synthase catalytic subunit